MKSCIRRWSAWSTGPTMGGMRPRDPNPGEIWDKVVASLQLLLRADGLVAHLDNLQELHQVLQRRIDRLSEGLSFPIGDFTSVLVHADNRRKRVP